MKTLLAVMLLAATPALAGDPVNDYLDARENIVRNAEHDYDARLRAYENEPVKNFELYQYRTQDGDSGYVYAVPVQ